MSSKVVCIVDDDEGVRAALDGLVRSLGYRSHVFPSAQALLDSSLVAQCDCLVLDVQMPGMSGLCLQQRLRALGRCPPLIFLTAFALPAWRDQALASGALAFMGKPYDCRALVELIEAACRLSAAE